MIQDDEQLNQTRAAITHLESAIAALKRDVKPINPNRFALMAEPAVAQIGELRALIDEYVGIKAAVSLEAELWMRIEGPDIEIGDAPTSVVTALLDILRRGIQSVGEFLQRGSVGTRPTASMKEACDLRIVGWMPGSVQVGLRFPEIPRQAQESASPVEQAREALSLYLSAASIVAIGEAPEVLERAIPDPAERRVLLNQIRQLVPRPRGAAELIELSGRSVLQGTIRLDRSARERVSRALAQTIPEELMSAQGVLREIDLDGRSFIVRDPDHTGQETRCEIGLEADDLLEIAKESLDHAVIVRGTRRKDSARRKNYPLRVQEIEIIDEVIDTLKGE